MGAGSYCTCRGTCSTVLLEAAKVPIGNGVAGGTFFATARIVLAAASKVGLVTTWCFWGMNFRVLRDLLDVLVVVDGDDSSKAPRVIRGLPAVDRPADLRVVKQGCFESFQLDRRVGTGVRVRWPEHAVGWVVLVQQEVDGVALVPVLEYVGRVLEVELLVLVVVVASDHVEDRVAGGCHRRRSSKEVSHDVSGVSKRMC